jgi:hypothetical protein
MLVNRIRGREDGSALIAVIGIMAVSLILLALVSSSIVNGMGFSSSTKAHVESQAAADAGVTAARAALYLQTGTAGSCGAQPTPGTFTSTTAGLNYSAAVSYRYSAGNAWMSGCPISPATQVRVVSVGTAADSGVQGFSTGNKTTVEAVFNYGLQTSGTDMFFYGGLTLNGNATLTLPNPTAGLVIKNGSLTCAKNGTNIVGNVTIDGGNLLLTQTCTIQGDASVSGTTAAGTGSVVFGSGNVTGKLTTTSGSPTLAQAPAGWATHYFPGSSPQSAPSWVNIGYAPSSWSTTPDIVTLSDGTCTLGGGAGTYGSATKPLNTNLPGTPIILDGRGCTSGVTVAGQNTTVYLSSDAVIYANQWGITNYNGTTFKSTTSDTHKLWLITPDTGTAGSPSCPSSADDFVINNNFVIDPTVTAMLYTPCAFVAKNGFSWRGQIYAAGTPGTGADYSDINQNPTFTYAPIGIAGANLSAGTTTPGLAPGTVIYDRRIG